LLANILKESKTVEEFVGSAFRVNQESKKT
jgi:hypothetical protein